MLIVFGMRSTMMKTLNRSLGSRFPMKLMKPFVTLQPAFSRLGVVGLLATASLLSGITIPVTRHAVNPLSSAAYAQDDPAVASYANAAYQIERLRQRRFSEAKREFPGGNVPANVCQQASIPATVRSICDEFMNESAEIIKSNGLSVSQFNEITRRKGSDPALQQQIDTELLRIQKKAP